MPAELMHKRGPKHRGQPCSDPRDADSLSIVELIFMADTLGDQGVCSILLLS